MVVWVREPPAQLEDTIGDLEIAFILIRQLPVGRIGRGAKRPLQVLRLVRADER